MENGIPDHLRVTMLGTGTSQGVPVIGCDCDVCCSEDPKDKRLRCSILVEWGGVNMVVDTGPDFRQQMLRANVQHLEAVIMTHAHKDHVAGLDDVRAFNFKQRQDMPVYADLRVQDALRREFYYIFEKDPYPGVPRVKLNTIDKEPFSVQGLPIIPIEVMHYKLPVLGFRFRDFAYITDAKTISKEEKKKLSGCHTLVINALRKEPHISHLTLDEALEWAEEFEAEHTYLTHISHLMGRHEEVSKELPQGVSIAYDGLSFDVPMSQEY